MTKTIHFNTGRAYGRHGQRIAATLHPDGRVTFFDYDRMVDGEFNLPDPALFSEGTVLGRYDRGSYTPSKASLEDGLLPGGCNTLPVSPDQEGV
jgi:hypothetical protein